MYLFLLFFFQFFFFFCFFFFFFFIFFFFFFFFSYFFFFFFVLFYYFLFVCRCVYQVCTVSVSFLASRCNESTNAGFGLSAFSNNGKGRDLFTGAFYPHFERRRCLESDFNDCRWNDDVYWCVYECFQKRYERCFGILYHFGIRDFSFSSGNWYGNSCLCRLYVYFSTRIVQSFPVPDNRNCGS